MKGDIHPAAFRLFSTLPVRTHEQTRSSYADRLSANNLRPVRVAGTLYESVTEAARRIGCSRGKVRLLLIKGEAQYV